MHVQDIANYSAREKLRDGRIVLIRAIRHDDKGQMAGAIRDLSPESIYRRTFAPKRELSDRELTQLTEVDFKDVVALVAVMTEEGQDRIVGGGRYVRSGGSDAGPRAEVAFLVGDGYQGFGIGSRIFKHLVVIARASGIAEFEAEVLPTNEGMLRVFSRGGLPVATTATRDSVHVVITLAPAA